MIPDNKPILLLIGSDSMLSYLLRRFADRSGYRVFVFEKSLPAQKINALAGVVFLSIEQLEKFQTMVEEFTNHDIPILVCSSVADEARARELGADYCLFHPLTYDNFSAVIDSASVLDAP
ncbi:MAG: hypothetical protein L6461_01440 [Anaerolineae bacterium]|nr:hypothetical protein [Anaerolineae bacterium]